MVDYTSWKIYEGLFEGSGRSEKVWLENRERDEIGLFKFNKSADTTEHVSERLAYELASRLGLPCARVEIGIYQDRLGSMSYLINEPDQSLIEGISLINKVYPDYDSNKMSDQSNGESYSFEMIRNSLERYGLFEEFVKVLIFDFLIGNTDRHQNNWAILQKGEEIHLCPIYDNGSSLCSYVAEDQIESYLGNDTRRFRALLDSKSRSMVRIIKNRHPKPTHYEMLGYIKEHHNDTFLDFRQTILDNVNEDLLNSILDADDYLTVSGRKKELIVRYILGKIMLLQNL